MPDATMSDVKATLSEIAKSNEEFKEKHLARLSALEMKMNRQAFAFGGGGGGPGPESKSEIEGLAKFLLTGEQKAMSIASDPTGGYTVPGDMDKQIQSVAALYSPLRKLARVVSGVRGGFAQVIATTLPGTAWVGESATRALTTTPAFAKVVPPSGELYANAPVTVELMQDSLYELGQWIVQEIGRSQGVNEGDAFITGNGITKPAGLASYTYAATADASRAFGTPEYVASGTNGTFDIDDLVDLLYKLSPEYRVPGRCAWLMSPGALQIIRKQKASTAGSYMWEPSSKEGQPSTLLGFPVHEASHIAAPATDSLSVFVGDFERGYTITDIGTPRFIRDEITVKGTINLYVARRIGGAMTDSNAIKALKLGTS